MRERILDSPRPPKTVVNCIAKFYKITISHQKQEFHCSSRDYSIPIIQSDYKAKRQLIAKDLLWYQLPPSSLAPDPESRKK